MEQAFTDEERQRIVPKVRLDKDGVETSDRVFIMNMGELEKYLDSMEERKTGATPYALSRGVYEYQDKVWWWVSDAGEASPFYAVYVNCIGDILKNGTLAFASDFGVRPAIWIR